MRTTKSLVEIFIFSKDTKLTKYNFATHAALGGKGINHIHV
jgi:hypothetical protein